LFTGTVAVVPIGYFRVLPCDFEMFSEGEIFHWWSRGTIVHYVLFFLCALALFLVIVCTVLPGSLCGRVGLSGGGLLSRAFFFSVLGLGFSFICISLMQRLSIYLGYEEGVLEIALPGLYLCTGVGCLYAGSTASARSQKGAVIHMTVGMTAVSFLWFFFPSALFLPEWLYVALVMIAIVPVGILLGSVLFIGCGHDSGELPAGWAFGIYSLALVGGTAACVTIAMRLGFSSTLIAGCLMYCACALIAARRQKIML